MKLSFFFLFRKGIRRFLRGVLNGRRGHFHDTEKRFHGYPNKGAVKMRNGWVGGIEALETLRYEKTGV